MLCEKQQRNCGSSKCAVCSTSRHQHDDAPRNASIARAVLAPALPTTYHSTRLDELDITGLIDEALAVLESDIHDDINITELLDDINITTTQ